MPIDYRKMSDDAETSLQDFIGGQQARSLNDINATRAGAQVGQGPLFQAAMGLGNDPAAFQEQAGFAQRRLGNNLETTLAARRMQEGRNALNMKYNNLVRRGGEQDSRLAAVNNYSRQTLQQNITQQQQAADLQRKINNQFSQQDEADSFAKQGVAQENSFAQSQNDVYQQAMYRALFGLVGTGASLGTYALMNRTPTLPNQTPMRPGGYGGTGQTYADLLNGQFSAQDQYKSLQPYMPQSGVNRRF